MRHKYGVFTSFLTCDFFNHLFWEVNESIRSAGMEMKVSKSAYLEGE